MAKNMYRDHPIVVHNYQVMVEVATIIARGLLYRYMALHSGGGLGDPIRINLVQRVDHVTVRGRIVVSEWNLCHTPILELVTLKGKARGYFTFDNSTRNELRYSDRSTNRLSDLSAMDFTRVGPGVVFHCCTIGRVDTICDTFNAINPISFTHHLHTLAHSHSHAMAESLIYV